MPKKQATEIQEQGEQQQQQQDQEQQDQEDGASGASGAGPKKEASAKKTEKKYPHPLWGVNPPAPIGNKWDGSTIKAHISEAKPSQIDKGDTSRILVKPPVTNPVLLKEVPKPFTAPKL